MVLNKDVKPTEQQIIWLEADISEEVGKELEIKNINFYDRDNDPKWYIMFDYYFSDDERTLPYELNVWVWFNGEEEPIGIEKVEEPNHGYPCSAIPIVKANDKGTGYVYES